MTAIQAALQPLLDGTDLPPDVISACVKEIADGAAPPAQVGAFLVALRKKGESVDEIAAFASTLRSYSTQIHPSVEGRIIDTCGTGGDRLKVLNVSTIAAFVAAGAGAVVAKHGGRSVTSKSGSADVVEKLGLNLNAPPSRVEESIEKVGIGFMFAPAFHPAMKHVAPIRKELGVRTVFNLMGPLINPARVNAQLLGLYTPLLVAQVAQVLAKLGTEEAMVVHGLEGTDEISVTGKTVVATLKDGSVDTKELSPRDFGLPGPAPPPRGVRDAEEGARTILDVLHGESSDEGGVQMVLLNSAASLILAKKAASFPEGIELASHSIKGGSAAEKLEEAIRFSGGAMEMLESYAKRQ